MEALEEKLKSLQEELFKISKAEKRLEELERLDRKLREDVSRYLAIMHKEKEDVERLEKKSSHFLFKRILGDKKEQLERERQEYLQSVLEYNAVIDELELIKYEYAVLKGVGKDKVKIQKEYEYHIKILEQKHLYYGTEKANQIKIHNIEIDRVRRFLRELLEAKGVAEHLNQLIKRARRKLRGVNPIDMYGVGKDSSYAKKKYIDHALKDAATINYHLQKLDKELSDVYSEYVFFSIYKYQNFIESFIDFMITDYVMASKFRNAMSCLDMALNQIGRILSTIEMDLEKGAVEIEKITEIKRQMLL